jgi:methylated-DNA-[protein]-cysteine S-methyltransferase
MTTTPPAPAPVVRAAAADVGPLLAVVLPSPAGDLTALLTEDGVVRAAGFAPVAAMAARLPRVVGRPVLGPGVLGPDAAPVLVPAADPAARQVAEAVARYADGEPDALGSVPVAQPGGPFQQRAWAAMRAIPAGSTLTYAGLALAAGSPAAVRAAGSACARNLVAPFVPCHRVLRSGGALGGYYYGVDVKRALLAHEAR